MRATVSTALALLLTALPASAGMKVKVDAEPGRDFTKFRTFAWSKVAVGIAPSTHQRVVAAVNRELSRSGMVLTDHDPDMLVSYDGVVTEDFKQGQGAPGEGPFAFGGASWYDIRETRSYLKGTLILSFADARSSKLVWRGTATDSIKDEPEKNGKKIDAAVRKLLAKFPPR